MEPDIPVRLTDRLKVSRKRFSFAAKAPPPSFIRKTLRSQRRNADEEYYDVDLPSTIRSDVILNRSGRLPSYDPLSDPHLTEYFRRKYQQEAQEEQCPRCHQPTRGGPATHHPRRRTHRHGPPSSSATSHKKKPASKRVRKEGPLYAIDLYTSEGSSKTSKSEKYVTLHGERGNSKRLLLAAPGVHFKAASKDSFQVQLHKSIGKLERITIENREDRKRDAWHVDKIIVRRLTRPLKTYTFIVGKWFSQYHGDQRTRRTISLSSGGGRLKPLSVDDGVYDVSVLTGDVSKAGTDSNVFITLLGEGGASQRTHLKKNTSKSFSRESKDNFTLNAIGLGTLHTCRVEHDNKGLGSAWFLDRVVVKHRSSGETYVFVCNDWISKKKGLVRDLPVSTASETTGGLTEWVVSTKTGDRRGAGTDARVYVVLLGKEGEVGPFELKKKSVFRNDFERGNLDTFNITAPRVGELERLRIYHDNSGAGPGWFLDSVSVIDSTNNKEYTFPCNRWFAKDEDDGKISRELRLTGSFSGAPYELHVTTGNKLNAATGANVYCILNGENGDRTSGKMPLENHSKNFSRNRTDIFPIKCDMLGPLHSIEIGHDNKGIGAGWFVERIALVSVTEGKKYTFECHEWFATDEGDRKIARNYFFDDAAVSHIRQKSLWLCRVVTSDIRHAGTDANPVIQIFGTEGKSDEIALRSFSNVLERATEDTFETEVEDIGIFTKLRVWHDNKGIAAGWHLARIEFEDLNSSAKYTFTCNRWLARSEDDGEIMRELPAEGPLVESPLPLLQYQVSVYTGNVSGAGTDANVHLLIFGKNGDTGTRILRKSKTHRNKFERGNVDEFIVEAVSLSTLTKILIGHDNKLGGASWFLDKVEIIDPSTGVTYTFPCNRWLSTKEDDGQIQRILPVLGDNDTVIATTTYIIKVATGDVRNAGTDANVYITLFGADGDSGKLFLRRSESFKNKFERKHTDVFRFELLDLGILERVIIGHDNSNLGSAWFLDGVTVEVPSNGKAYSFPCGRWLSKKDDDRQIERELYVDETSNVDMEVASNMVVRVFTSDIKYAGTDSKVFVVIYGEDGKTDEIQLTNKSNNFERGKVEEFKISASEVGKIVKMRIGHDSKGIGSDWHLNKVELHDLKLNLIYTCVIDKWVKKEKGSKLASVEAPVSLIETIEDGKRETVEEIDISESMVHYEVSVHTSDISGAGTDANVYIILYGTNHDTGERSLSKSSTHRNKFERGNVDVFDVAAVDLGELTRVRVWHDNWGAGPAWHLDKIVVKDPVRGEEKLFLCDNWLSKKRGDKQISRELGAAQALPDELQHKAITHTYNVHVHTADVRYAGTDANVFIRLYGENSDTGNIDLTKSLTHTNKWERGNVDEFVLNAVDIGDLKKIRIGHDGKGVGAGWCLDKVIIDAPLSGKTWTFNCGEWLDVKSGDGSLERLLVPDETANTEYEAKVPWEVIVRTSDVKGAGTDAKVFMEVFGRKEDGTVSSDKHEFSTEKRLFETGSEDRFNILLADVGDPFKLRVGHNNKGLFAAWHCDSITLINQVTSHAYEFPCGLWFKKGKDTKLVNELAVKEVKAALDGEVIKQDAAISLEKVEYTIHVFTGDVSKAGTDANVYLKLFGELGESEDIKLSKSRTYRDKFERGHEDIFDYDCIDLGVINKVLVWHDNKGVLSAPSWFLDKIVIKVPSQDREFKFICEKWLSKKHGDKEISRELSLWVDPSIAQAEAAAKLTELDEQQAALEEAVEKASLSGKKLTKKQRESFRKQAEELETAREEAQTAVKDALVAVQAKGVETIEYSIMIETKDVEHAGTTAPVSIEILGEKERAKGLEGSLNRSASVSSGDQITSAALNEKELVATTTGTIQLTNDSSRFNPGNNDQFSIHGVDVGTIKSLRIGHDGESADDDWFIDHIELVVPSKGIRATFGYGDWLSINSTTTVLLEPTTVDELDKMVEYEIEVFTGDAMMAGTNSKNVSFVLCGDKKNTAPYCPKDLGSFSRNKALKFNFKGSDIGLFTKAIVKHDASGLGANWLLDKLVIKCPEKDLEVTLPFGQWMKETKGEYELFPERRQSLVGPDGEAADLESSTATLSVDMKKYVIHVKTGSVKGAGTDANVSCELFGTLGKSKTLKLKKSQTHRDKFERGNTDIFDFTIGALGQLTKLRIWHDNAMLLSSWYLEEVTVIEEDSNSTYHFPCQKWLSKSKGDKQIVRELLCASAAFYADMVTYKVEVGVSAANGSSTDGDLLVTIIGEEDKRQTFTLANENGDKFEKGSTPSFVFEGTPSVGEILGVVVELAGVVDDKGKEVQPSPITIATLVVTEVETAKTYSLLEVGDERTISDVATFKLKDRDALAETATQRESVLYTLRVFTGDVRGAGTDATVFAILHGEHGDTGERSLSNSKTHKNKFERNNEDVFEIEAIDLGTLTKLDIRHDNRRFGADWYLAKVVVEYGDNQITFECNEWLNKSKGVSRSLTPSSTSTA